MPHTRRATHAGSWYTSDSAALEAELEANLDRVSPIVELDYDPPVANAKAIIAPHAGYSYSGPAAAWAYAALDTSKIRRVFLLGPSHHAYLSGVALSRFEEYATPLGNLKLCGETISKLRSTGAFSEMKASVDEDEHSLEMHLPYIRHIFKDREDVRLVPLLVGQPSHSISSILEEYWKDDSTFFIISSDFCHWGTRFSCTPYYPNAPHPPHPVPPVSAASDTPSGLSGPLKFDRKYTSPGSVPIWQSIQYLDHEGMDILRRPADPGADEAWDAYLTRTKNTICGRNPISLLVDLLQHLYTDRPEVERPKFTFVRYEQSSQCTTARDSSVSYVSGILRL